METNQEIKPGKPQKDDGSNDCRRRVDPDNKPKYPDLKPGVVGRSISIFLYRLPKIAILGYVFGNRSHHISQCHLHNKLLPLQ